MYAFGVTGPGSESLVADLVAALPGRTATVTAGTAAAPTDAATIYALAEGAWRATGEGLSLPEALDRLAPDHDYAIAVEFPGARLPQVAVGDAAPATDPIATVDSAADADVDAVVEAVEATDPHETLESLVAAVKRSPRADRSGAIATFTGRVRAKDAPDDERTEYLKFEKYEGVAEERMAALEAELEEREGVFDVVMHHRTGVLEAGEDIVFVVVLAGHRTEAFRTVADGIDRLKEEVPIFKKEVTTGEEFWVHTRE
ncbi:MAG: molybdopterin synthase [Haloarculaceae archaeon]